MPEPLDTMLALRAEGRSYQAIAAELNRRRVASPQGCRWYGASVLRLIRSYPSELTSHRSDP